MSDPAEPTVITQHLSVTGLAIFAACSDGKLRRVVLNEREATKALALITHKVFGGVLRLQQAPISHTA